MNKSISKITKEDLRKVVRFERPDFIPMKFGINDACWDTYPQEALFELMEQHPLLFPDFKRPDGIYVPEYEDVARKDEPFKDDFGCVWVTTENGITGTVHGHPLEEWEQYKDFVFPNPDYSTGLRPINWAEFERECEQTRKEGAAVYGNLRHGHTFLQLCDLRGYENLLFDMMDEEPLLEDLIQKLETFNIAQIQHFLKANVDVVQIPEDLGMQVGPMLSPDQFVRYIKPSYQRMIATVHEAGKLVHMHSDGDIRLLANHLVEGGVDILNLQDKVNGIDWIAENFRGHTCIELDLDRQTVTPYGTPEQIEALIREEVEKISCREGGLMLLYGLYPGIPLENVKAVMDAMEKYAFYYD